MPGAGLQSTSRSAGLNGEFKELLVRLPIDAFYLCYSRHQTNRSNFQRTSRGNETNNYYRRRSPEGARPGARYPAETISIFFQRAQTAPTLSIKRRPRHKLKGIFRPSTVTLRESRSKAISLPTSFTGGISDNSTGGNAAPAINQPYLASDWMSGLVHTPHGDHSDQGGVRLVGPGQQQRLAVRRRQERQEDAAEVVVAGLLRALRVGKHDYPVQHVRHDIQVREAEG